MSETIQPLTQMRAIYAEEYGSPKEVLHLKKVPRPQVEGGNVLIRIIAAATHAGDWHLIRGEPYFIRLLFGGIWKPKVHIPGCEMCGVVESIGDDVDRDGLDFTEGDTVFGDVSGSGFGAFAEYICVPPEAVVKKPDNITCSEAAASCTSALTALQVLRDAGAVLKGKRVLINGASGGVGTFATQIAKSYGAHVTSVCHESKVSAIEKLGADVVIDYTKHDVTEQEGVEKFDAIIDAACFRSPVAYLKILKPGGKLLVVGGATSRFLQMAFAGPWISWSKGVEARFFESKPKKQDLISIRDMLAKGVIVPLIDREFSLEQTGDAVSYVEGRHVTGKVVITI